MAPAIICIAAGFWYYEEREARMLEQGERFTVAFSDCQEQCTRGAFDFLWPMDLNSRMGTCL